jgi:O-antigen/teichoic acid export membrane protein
VFFGEASIRREDPRRFHDLAYNATVSLLVFAIPTYMIVAVAGQALIQVVFGPQWALAGLYAQILAPSLIFWSVASPISSLLLVGRRERESLAFTAAELGLKIGAFAIGALVGSLTVGIVALSAVTIAIDTGALWRFLRVPGVRLGELVRPAAKVLALTIPSLVLVIAVEVLLPVGIVIACAVGWLAAFGLSLRYSPEAKALLSGSHD